MSTENHDAGAGFAGARSRTLDARRRTQRSHHGLRVAEAELRCWSRVFAEAPRRPPAPAALASRRGKVRLGRPLRLREPPCLRGRDPQEDRSFGGVDSLNRVNRHHPEPPPGEATACNHDLVGAIEPRPVAEVVDDAEPTALGRQHLIALSGGKQRVLEGLGLRGVTSRVPPQRPTPGSHARTAAATALRSALRP